MARDVSIGELRNSTAPVIAELEAGERMTLTVNRRPVAAIVPHTGDRDPWVPAADLRRILRDAPAIPGSSTTSPTSAAPRGVGPSSGITVRA